MCVEYRKYHHVRCICATLIVHSSSCPKDDLIDAIVNNFPFFSQDCTILVSQNSMQTTEVLTKITMCADHQLILHQFLMKKR